MQYICSAIFAEIYASFSAEGRSKQNVRVKSGKSMAELLSCRTKAFAAYNTTKRAMHALPCKREIQKSFSREMLRQTIFQHETQCKLPEYYGCGSSSTLTPTMSHPQNLQHPTPPTCAASWKRGMAAAARALACLSGLVAASCRAARPSCSGERGGLRDPSGSPGEGVRMRRLLGNSTGDARRFRLAFCSSDQMCEV